MRCGAPWDVYAPDWRGYGLTDWGKADCYWFPDYIADLDALLEHIDPGAPVNLVGHSLGGNVAALYAGVRPARIARFVNLEGFGMAPTQAEQAPKRYARWLEELRDPPGLRSYESFSALADRLQQGNKRLSREQAEFLARHWGQEATDKGVVLRGDPAHKIVNPVLYRYEEVRACWQRSARAGVVGGGRRVGNTASAAPECSADCRAPCRLCECEGGQRAGSRAHAAPRSARSGGAPASRNSSRADGPIFRHPPDASAEAAHPPGGGHRAPRRRHRLSDRFLLRAWLRSRRTQRARAPAPHPRRSTSATT